MTADIFIKELENFLWPDIAFEDKHKQRIKHLLDQYRPPVTKTERVVERVVVEKMVSPEQMSIESIDLEAEVDEACAEHGVTREQFFGITRKPEVVQARCQFARSIIYKCPTYPRSRLGRYLRKNHSTIVQYIFWTKTPCKYPPLPPEARLLKRTY